mmetsp:Transcript_5146/g.19284  ORF Transcript_5146/g.19284 Transcript_5146/m.19284 type:complete len:137 (+) Transcript_5146:105-515(+)
MERCAPTNTKKGRSAHTMRTNSNIQRPCFFGKTNPHVKSIPAHEINRYRASVDMNGHQKRIRAFAEISLVDNRHPSRQCTKTRQGIIHIHRTNEGIMHQLHEILSESHRFQQMNVTTVIGMDNMNTQKSHHSSVQD